MHLINFNNAPLQPFILVLSSKKSLLGSHITIHKLELINKE